MARKRGRGISTLVGGVVAAQRRRRCVNKLIRRRGIMATQTMTTWHKQQRALATTVRERRRVKTNQTSAHLGRVTPLMNSASRL